MTSQSRSKLSEEASMKVASARFAALSHKQQMRILCELIETRSAELELAYPNVVRLGIGRRRQRDSNGLSKIRDQEPACVLFMVKRKWSRNSKREGRIPTYLLTYTHIRGKRQLVAAPTDVDAASWLLKARANANIFASIDGAQTSEEGAFCCAIKNSSGNTVFGMSCRHVLSFGAFADESSDFVEQNEVRIGQIKDIRGPSRGANVMDAQLFLITGGDADIPRFSGTVNDVASIPISLTHGAPSLDDASRSCSFRGLWQRPKRITLTADNWMFAGELVEVDLPGKSTIAGDSGSPIATCGQQRKLVGMHIGIARSAGVDGVASICIPAWRLMDPHNYEGAPANAAWSVL